MKRKKYIYKKRKKIDVKFIKIILISLIPLIAILIAINSTNKNSLDIPVENLMAFKISYENLTKLKELSVKYNINFSELVTYYSLENNYFDDKTEIDDKIEQNFIINYDSIKNKYKSKDIEDYYNLFDSIYNEIKCFPIPITEEEKNKYVYGDSWGAQRTYDGKRIHMGTDIMDRENIEGRIQIVSMTDGTITNLGWNNRGGWRVGITSDNGNYYYYAHLDKFNEEIKKDAKVKAGDLIGYMGNTGYSKTEGTKGNFEVHLHVGIMPENNFSKEEFWINPYPFLRMIENNNIQ